MGRIQNRALVSSSGNLLLIQFDLLNRFQVSFARRTPNGEQPPVTVGQQAMEKSRRVKLACFFPGILFLIQLEYVTIHTADIQIPADTPGRSTEAVHRGAGQFRAFGPFAGFGRIDIDFVTDIAPFIDTADGVDLSLVSGSRKCPALEGLLRPTSAA